MFNLVDGWPEHGSAANQILGARPSGGSENGIEKMAAGDSSFRCSAFDVGMVRGLFLKKSARLSLSCG